MNTFKTAKGTTLPLMNMRGKDYLEVKWRIVWFREEHPDWSIQTEFVSIDASSALAKATIITPDGRAASTSHKFEDKQGFADFREKAETGAIGRALALIGFGTQFCADELDEGTRIVDSPVGKDNPHAAKNMQPGPEDGDGDFSTGVYKIPFGQWRSKSLAEVARDPKCGPDKIASYIEFLENSAAKKKEPLGQMQVEFIREAEKFLGGLENGTMRLPE